MLSETSRPIIAATLPLVGSRIGHITPEFYKKMFHEHPELLDGIFSTNNQRTGEQPQALAGSIAVFATALIQHPNTTPEALLARIAHKHTSLGITPEQYDIVYENLFAAIAEDLADVITPEIAAAWTEVYWLMADALIALEKDLYGQQANDKIWMPWRVTAKTSPTPDTVSFTLEPADDTPVTPAVAGQYVSVKVLLPSGIHQARQYTLTNGGGCERMLTTKRDDAGEVSPRLHDHVQVGDVIEVSNPYGDITLAEGNTPVVFATAGIGCTPSAAMLRALATEGSTRAITVLHAERSLSNWALREQMCADLSALSQARLELWTEDGAAQAADAELSAELSSRTTVHSGRMSLAGVDIAPDADLYICGPLPFMKAIRDEAIAAGLSPRKVHYEIFGPDVWHVS